MGNCSGRRDPGPVPKRGHESRCASQRTLSRCIKICMRINLPWGRMRARRLGTGGPSSPTIEPTASVEWIARDNRAVSICNCRCVTAKSMLPGRGSECGTSRSYRGSNVRDNGCRDDGTEPLDKVTRKWLLSGSKSAAPSAAQHGRCFLNVGWRLRCHRRSTGLGTGLAPAIQAYMYLNMSLARRHVFGYVQSPPLIPSLPLQRGTICYWSA